MGWKHYQTVDHPKWEPKVGRGLFGIRLLILHLKFQFSKSIKSLTSHIFLNLTYPLSKKYLFPKMPKNHPKTYTKSPNSGSCNKQRDLALLETWPIYWQKGRVKRRQNSLHVYPRLNLVTGNAYCCHKWRGHLKISPHGNFQVYIFKSEFSWTLEIRRICKGKSWFSL